MQSVRFGVDVFHESLAFAASRQRFPGAGERGKSHLEELIHPFDRLNVVVEFALEYLNGVLEDGCVLNLMSDDNKQI